MIFDKIENQHLYRGLGSKFDKAFSYLNTTDLQKVAPGKYLIEGEELFAIIMEYDTLPIAENSFEGHQKYIDLQYVIEGTELVGITTLFEQNPFEVHIDDDYSLFQIEDAPFLTFDKGMFMIFFPDDLHMPSVHQDKMSKVKKLVIKIAV